MNTQTKYCRITLEEREEISRQLATGVSIRKIASHLGREPSTISREVNRSYFDRHIYRAIVAEKLTRKRRRRQGRKRILDKYTKLKNLVLAKLKLRWSPEQIANHLKNVYLTNKNMRISPESIYQYLFIVAKGSLKKELLSYLRQQRQCRRKHGSKRGKSSGIPDIVSIHERPKEVEDRIVPGHWEGDLIMGKARQSALGTLVERTTRTTILVPLESHHALNVRMAFAKEIKKVPEQMRQTLTYDRGREMVEHKLFTKETKVKVYFCDPQSPWQRGTNENTNMLIRQFFPKGTNFTKITRKEIKYVQKLLNERPRKILSWRTPKETFNQLLR